MGDVKSRMPPAPLTQLLYQIEHTEIFGMVRLFSLVTMSTCEEASGERK